MITVEYRPKHYCLKMTGHARSGEEGHDLVCSAASILVYTLAANVASLKERRAVRDYQSTLNKGEADIRCTPYTKMDSVVSLCFDTVCTGFALLARDYPENIKFDILP